MVGRYSKRSAAGDRAPVWWTTVTFAWTAVAMLLPVNRALPTEARTAWFFLVFGLIFVSAITIRVSTPLFPLVWLYAGVASTAAVLTATNSGTIGDNIFVGAQLVALIGFGPFVMTANSLYAPYFVRSVTTAFMISQSVSSIAGMTQLFGYPVLGIEMPLEGRAPGLTSHPNAMGFMASVAVIVSLGAMLRYSRHRFVFLVILFVNLGGLLSTGSLSALMATALGVIAVIVTHRDHFGYALAAIGLVSVLAWLISKSSSALGYFHSPADRYMQVTGQTSADSSWQIRERTYMFAWSRIQDDPLFGNGLSTRFGGTFNGTTVTHSFPLRSWYQGGVLLGIAAIVIVLSVLVVVVWCCFEKRHAVPCGVLVSVMAFALTSAFFEQPDYWLPVLLAWSVISIGQADRKGRMWRDVSHVGAPKTLQPSLPLPIAYDRAPVSLFRMRNSGQGSESM